MRNSSAQEKENTQDPHCLDIGTLTGHRQRALKSGSEELGSKTTWICLDQLSSSRCLSHVTDSPCVSPTVSFLYGS